MDIITTQIKYLKKRIQFYKLLKSHPSHGEKIEQITKEIKRLQKWQN